MALLVAGDGMAVGCDKVVSDVTRSDVEALARYTKEELECESLEYSHTPMTMAATMGSTAVLSRLLEKGVKIDGKPGTYSPLLVALMEDKAEAAEFLIRRGANINAVTYDGISYLSLAVVAGRLAAVRQLLAAGATISTTKASPLVNAIHLNRLDLVEVLLDAGAATNFELAGQTPLEWAVSDASEDVVLRLLAAGANPKSRRKSRKPSPLWVATRRGFLKAASEMRSRGARDRQEQGALLLHAAERNDLRLARVALQRFARVDSVDRADPLHPTSLSIAAGAGSMDVAQLLLRHHARVNRADVAKQTPLLRAAGAGRAAMVKVLLAHGADVEAADYLGRTPLIAAAEKGSLVTIRILLEHGAAINAISDGGIFPRQESRFESGRGTAYHAARTYRHDEVAAYLLERGADPLLQAVDFEAELWKIYANRVERARALNLAIERRDIESVRRLATLDILNALFMNPSLDQPLCHAGYVGFTEAAALLLERGAEVNPRFAMRPLVCALEGSHANRKDLAIVRMLLDRGAVTDVPFRHLIDAASTVEAMKLMLERGAALPRDVAERLLVKKIRDWGEIEAIQFLLDHGASINARTQSGRPLWTAATQVDPALTKCLIELGADVNSADDSPISAAVHQDHQTALDPNVLATLDVLFEAGANPDLSAGGDWAFSPIHEAATKHVEVLERLIRAGADLERKDFFGDHPLHFAIRALRTDNVRALVDAGANVNSWNTNGETPLILAAMKGYREMVDILVAAGADETRRDRSGKTALDWAQSLRNDRAASRLKTQ